ncbi:MAG: hypothetical protein ABMA13_23570 [Chthoniobacteraceae bacterium]
MHKGSKIWSLEALTSDPLATRNTILFAALTAVGIPAEPDLCGEYVEEIHGERVSATVWRLRDRSLDGKFPTEDLIKLWNDPEFTTKHPEHPLAYIKCAFENHTRAVAFIKEQGPIAMRRRGKKIALITRHTSPELKARILDELNK